MSARGSSGLSDVSIREPSSEPEPQSAFSSNVDGAPTPWDYPGARLSIHTPILGEASRGSTEGYDRVRPWLPSGRRQLPKGWELTLRQRLMHFQGPFSRPLTCQESLGLYEETAFADNPSVASSQQNSVRNFIELTNELLLGHTTERPLCRCTDEDDEVKIVRYVGTGSDNTTYNPDVFYPVYPYSNKSLVTVVSNIAEYGYDVASIKGVVKSLRDARQMNQDEFLTACVSVDDGKEHPAGDVSCFRDFIETLRVASRMPPESDFRKHIQLAACSMSEAVYDVAKSQSTRSIGVQTDSIGTDIPEV